MRRTSGKGSGRQFRERSSKTARINLAQPRRGGIRL